jgi:uncharacterized membrane protein
MNSTLRTGAMKRALTAPSRETIIWGFLALGILSRARQYLFDRSIWLDESLLAQNIIHRSASGLLKPLDHYQGAPLGFLLLEKMAVLSFGSSEMALRLVPFLCGILSLFLFTRVARRFLAPTAVPIAVGLFAISDSLIYYSAEAKQYSSDVAVAVFLYLLAGPLLEVPPRIIRTVAVSVAAAIALWFSHPAAFILAGWGLSSLWVSLRKKDRRTMVLLFIPGILWSCSFLLFYFVSLRGLSNDRTLLEYWEGAFAPFPPSSLADARWFVDSFFDLFSGPVGLTLTGIAGVATLLGAIELFSERRPGFLLLITPAALTLLASAFHRYPFRGRLLLFLVPSIILLIAAGLGTVHMKTRDAVPLLGVLLIGFLFVNPIVDVAVHLIKPRTREEIKPVIQYVTSHHLEGDVLYLYYSSALPFEYYSERRLIEPMNEIIGRESRQSWKFYREDLDQLRGNKRVWILFSHVYSGAGANEERLFLDYLDSLGKRVDSSRAPGASIYLYDLSSHTN